MPSGFWIRVTMRISPPTSSVQLPEMPRSSSKKYGTSPSVATSPPITAPETIVIPPM